MPFTTFTYVRQLPTPTTPTTSTATQSMCVSIVIPFVAEQCSASRSSVARNALMTMEDLVAACGSDRRYCGAVIAVRYGHASALDLRYTYARV